MWKRRGVDVDAKKERRGSSNQHSHYALFLCRQASHSTTKNMPEYMHNEGTDTAGVLFKPRPDKTGRPSFM